MRITTSGTSRTARSSSAIALFACGLLACTAGEAASVANGSNLNGHNLNGVNLNGVSVNGVSVNGSGLTHRERSSHADRGDRTRPLDINRLRVTGVTLAPPASARSSG